MSDLCVFLFSGIIILGVNMIRERLCSYIKNFKSDSGMSYTDMCAVTNLSRSQLFNILNNNGDGVKVERMEEVVYLCGLSIRMELDQ